MLKKLKDIYRKIERAGIKSDYDLITTGQIKLINICSLIISILAIPFLLLYLLNSHFELAVFSAVGGIVFFIPFVLNFLGKHKLSKIGFIFGLNLYILSLNLFLNSDLYLQFAFILPISLSFFLYRDKGKLIHFISISLLAAIIFIEHFNLLSYNKIEIPEDVEGFSSLLFIMTILGLYWLFFIIFIKSLIKYEKKINTLINKTKGQYQDIKIINAQLTDHKEHLEEIVSKRTEGIKEAEQLLRSIINSSLDLIFYKDQNGRYLGCNKAFAEYLGIEQDDIKGKTDYDYYDGDRADIFAGDDKKILKIKQVSFYEEWVVNSTGKRIFLDTIKSPLLNDEEEIFGFVGISRDLTLLKSYQNALEESERKYKTLYETSLDAIIMLSPDGRLIAGNPASVKLYRCENEKELISHSVYSFSPEYQSDGFRSEDKIMQLLKTVLRNGSCFFEWVHKLKDGSEFYAKILLTRMEIGKKTLLQANVRDITKQVNAKKKIEYNLKNQELVASVSVFFNYLNQFEETINIALKEIGKHINVSHIFVVNDFDDYTKNTYEWCNQGVNQCFENLKATQYDDLLLWKGYLEKVSNINSNNQEKLPDKIKLFMDSKGVKSILIIPLNFNSEIGGFICFEEHINKREWKNDEINILTVIANIISHAYERRKTGLELKESEQKFRKIINNQGEGLCIFDKEGNITFFNPVASKIFGVGDNGLTGKNLREFIDEKPLNRILYENGIKAKGETLTYEIELKRPDKSKRFILLTASPEYNQKGEVISSLGIFRDISKRKKIEAELVVAKEKAEESDRLKSEFLANISHETRTPLNLIMGFSDIIESKLKDFPNEQIFVRKIKMAGNNLLTILDNILDLSKIEAGVMVINKEAVNPYLLIKEIEQAFSARITQKSLAFTINTDENLPKHFLLDKIRVRQVLFNLIGNAIKFTETGFVKVNVSASFSGKSSKHIDLIVEVEDSGIGVNDEMKELIFAPFRQVDGSNNRKFEGTGMGLTIAKRLTEIMNGEISVVSEEDKGSLFKIILRNVEIC